MFSLRNLCAVEEASVYLYFPTLVCCDKEKEKTSCSKSVKVHMQRKQNKIKVKQKMFHTGLSMCLAGFEIYGFTQTGCMKQGQNPPATPLSLQKQTVLRSTCCSGSRFQRGIQTPPTAPK